MDWATRVCSSVVAGISQAQVVYTVLRITEEMLHTFTAGLINSDLQVP
jgi:hypothetical protein